MALKNGNKGANGGARKGAGRKPKAYTLLKRRLEAEKVEEAEKSIDFYIQVRDNPNESTALRLEAATLILDRVLGKAKEHKELSGEVTVKGYVNVNPDDWDKTEP